MGLISKTVKVKWNGRTKKQYESLGYVFTNTGDEFEVKVEDLLKGSNVKIVNESRSDNGRFFVYSFHP